MYAIRSYYELADGPHAAVPEVVDVVREPPPLIEIDEEAHDRHEVVLGQDRRAPGDIDKKIDPVPGTAKLNLDFTHQDLTVMLIDAVENHLGQRRFGDGHGPTHIVFSYNFV